MLCIFSKRDKVKLCFDHKTRGRNRPLVIHATLIKLNYDTKTLLMLAWLTNVSTSPDLYIEFSTDP